MVGRFLSKPASVSERAHACPLGLVCIPCEVVVNLIYGGPSMYYMTYHQCAVTGRKEVKGWRCKEGAKEQ